MNSYKTSSSSHNGLAGHNSESESEEAPRRVPTNLNIKKEPGLPAARSYHDDEGADDISSDNRGYDLAAEDGVIGSSTPTHPSSGRKPSTSIANNNNNDIASNGGLLGGNLVIKVVGDSLTNGINQPEIVSQLSKKLGVKVILQLENSDGEVVFEDLVSSSSAAEQTSEDNESAMDSEPIDSKLFPLNNGVKEEAKCDNFIVNTVLNAIRELANKLGRMEQLKDCPICGDTVTGFHYGVQTCESCKGFFKRTVQNKKEFKCARNNECEIHISNRKKCPACRFNKCCEVGMRVEGIREDRSRGGRSTYEGATAFLHRRFKRLSENYDHPPTPLSKKVKLKEPTTPETVLPKPIIPDVLQKIVSLETLYEEATDKPLPCCQDRMTNGDKNKFSSMLHITEHRLYQIVKWARNLPNFLNVPTQDQILLLQNSWAELTSLGAIWRSKPTPNVIQLSYGKTIDMERAREMDHQEVISRMLYVCDSFRRLEVDQYEYSALKTLALMLPDISGLENPSMIQDYQNTLLDALMVYTTTHYPHYPLKFGELLLRLSEVQRLTSISRQQIRHLQSTGEVPRYNLLVELLRHQGYTKSGAQLTDAQALHVINTNYEHEDITPQHSFDPMGQISEHHMTQDDDIVEISRNTSEENTRQVNTKRKKTSVTRAETSTNGFSSHDMLPAASTVESSSPLSVRASEFNSGSYSYDINGRSDQLPQDLTSPHHKKSSRSSQPSEVSPRPSHSPHPSDRFKNAPLSRQQSHDHQQRPQAIVEPEIRRPSSTNDNGYRDGYASTLHNNHRLSQAADNYSMRSPVKSEQSVTTFSDRERMRQIPQPPSLRPSNDFLDMMHLSAMPMAFNPMAFSRLNQEVFAKRLNEQLMAQRSDFLAQRYASAFGVGNFDAVPQDYSLDGGGGIGGPGEGSGGDSKT